jgi:hypothetical protein
MTPAYHAHVDSGRYVACVTTNGLDHIRIPTAAFGKPRDAIRYCEMRQAAVSPLRSSDDDPASAPPAGSSPEQPTGSSTTSPDVLTR